MNAPADAVSRGPARLLAGRVGGVAGSLVLSQVLVGLTYVVAARSITPATLGIVATCFAIATISSTVFDLGLVNYLVRELASTRLDPPAVRALVRRKRRFAVLLTGPAVLACLLLAPDVVTGLLLGAVAPLLWESATANSLLRAQGQFARAATGQLLGRTAGLLATATTAGLGVTGLALPLGLATGFAVEVIIDRIYLGAPGAPAAAAFALGRAQWASMSFGLASLAAVGQQLDTPMVAAGGGAAAAGLYAGAGRLLGPLLFLSSALAMVGLPWLARAAGDAAALRAEERRLGRLTAVLSLAPLAAAALGPPVIPLILGEQYRASGAAFTVLAVGAALSTLNQGMAIVLQNRGNESTVARAIGIGLVQGLAATYVLALLGGPVWAAAGFSVSQLYIVVHLAVRLRAGRRSVPPSPSEEESPE